jgi:hypothetical protein
MTPDPNPKINLPDDEISPTFHNVYYDAKGYMIVRPKMRLDIEPIRKLLLAKRQYYSMPGLAMRTRLPQAAIDRIMYREAKDTHIDKIDRICIAFDTSIREVYGE